MGSFQIDVSHGLSEIEQACWEMMENASKNRHAGMHHMVVGTVREGKPEIRTVILRGVNKEERRVYFHTDSRKEMFTDMSSGESISLLVYDQQLRSQIRMKGYAIVHHMDELCKQRWAKTADYSRRSYLQPGVPGLPAESPELPDNLRDFSYTLEESEVGFNNFVVMECVIENMDWYFAHHQGNRRANFVYEGQALSYSDWLHS